MTAARWQAGIRLLATYKKISTVMPADTVFSTRFLPAS
jgi:hypothetical protein